MARRRVKPAELPRRLPTGVTGALELGALAELAPILGNIYREPQANTIPKAIDALAANLGKSRDVLIKNYGKQIAASSCGGDLGTVIIIVMIVGPAPGPT